MLQVSMNGVNKNVNIVSLTVCKDSHQLYSKMKSCRFCGIVDGFVALSGGFVEFNTILIILQLSKMSEG